MRKELLRFCRKVLGYAQRDMALNPNAAFGSAALPFDSRLNIYDGAVIGFSKVLEESKGEDIFVLNAQINEVLGRHELPENPDEVKDAKIKKLENEVALLKKELGRG